MIYEVKSPILGLEQIKKVKFSEIDDYFVHIRGLSDDGSDTGIELRLVNPYLLRQDYALTVPVAIQTLMEIHKDSNKVRAYCVVVWQQPIENSRVNFLAPILFNEDNKTVAQVELSQIEYPNFGIADPISNYQGAYIGSEPTIYELKAPILGFEKIKKIALTKRDDNFITINIRGLHEDNTDSGIEMTLVNPYIKKDYSITISDDLRDKMGMTNQSSVLVYCPLVIQKPIEESLINFLAPIVFHIDNKTAAQVELQASEYPEYGISEPIRTFINHSV